MDVTAHIHITGASGAGVTTLGAALAERLGGAQFDVDDFFWMPTVPPFTDKRPVAAVADHSEVRDVASVEIRMEHAISMHMLFDPGHSLDERILREQFGY